MKLKRILLALSAIACLSVNAQEVAVPTWKTYLENLKKGWTPNNYKGDMKELKVVDYIYKGEMNSAKEISQIVDAMFADQAPVNSVTKEIALSDTTITKTDTIINVIKYPEFEILTMREKINAGKLSEDSISTLKQQIKESIPTGTGYVEVVWSYKGKEYRSISLIVGDIPVDCITMGLSTGGSTMTKGIRKAPEA